MVGSRGSGWINAVKAVRRGSRKCKTCGGAVDKLPVNCSEVRHREYYEKNKQWRRNYERNIGAAVKLKRRWNERMALLKLLGTKCISCGVEDPRVLQINHKNGGGAREIRQNRDKPHFNPRKFYLSILRGERRTDDLEIRCANCNIIYEYEVGRRNIPNGDDLR